MNRRRFTAIAATGLAASIFGGLKSPALAIRPGPTTGTDALPGVTDFMSEFLSMEPDQMKLFLTERGLEQMPEINAEGNFFSIQSITPDLNGDLNVYVVYSGLRQEGGLYYDRFLLKVANGTYTVDQWENRLPTIEG